MAWDNTKLPKGAVILPPRPVHDELVHIAAELVMGAGVPSIYREDWPKRITWAEIQRRLEVAEERAKTLGCRVSDLAKQITV